MKNPLEINPAQETNSIVKFIKNTFSKQKLSHAVIGLSGGIDSATSLFLLKEALPINNIHVTHLYYYDNFINKAKTLIDFAKIPKENFLIISIKKPVDNLIQLLKISKDDNVRTGNIMARVRMIILFDLAKKNKALVCGTENKTEHLLGYFTRFGDAASDIEPIQHLYKTQVYQLAEYLKIPEFVIDQAPTAGLWQGQTDEGEFGFTYEEADKVLYSYFEKKISIEELIKNGLKNAKKIITLADKNKFKHLTPFSISPKQLS